MARLPQVTGERMVRALRRAGYHLERWHGSHAILDNGQITLTVPCHAGRNLKKGTLASILKDAGLSVEEFLALL